MGEMLGIGGEPLDEQEKRERIAEFRYEQGSHLESYSNEIAEILCAIIPPLVQRSMDFSFTFLQYPNLGVITFPDMWLRRGIVENAIVTALESTAELFCEPADTFDHYKKRIGPHTEFVAYGPFGDTWIFELSRIGRMSGWALSVRFLG